MAFHFTDDGRRFPIFGTVLKGHKGIPVQRTIINLRYMGLAYSFLLAYRYDPIFTRNRALNLIYRHLPWFGDMVVLKMGVLSDYVHVTPGRERAAARRAVIL